jgi:hypothetical protein
MLNHRRNAAAHRRLAAEGRRETTRWRAEAAEPGLHPDEVAQLRWLEADEISGIRRHRREAATAMGRHIAWVFVLAAVLGSVLHLLGATVTQTAAITGGFAVVAAFVPSGRLGSWHR